jgi:hypothetical protein
MDVSILSYLEELEFRDTDASGMLLCICAV